MLPRFETITRIQNVSTELSLGTQVWRTHRGDKTPVVIPVGSETGDDTILATTDGRTLNIDYVTAAGPGPVLGRRTLPGNYTGRQSVQAEPDNGCCILLAARELAGIGRKDLAGGRSK